MNRILFVLSAFIAANALAWHTPPHQQMTQAAIDSLPSALPERLGREKETLIRKYCMYPDHYRALANVKPDAVPEPQWLAEISPRTRENFERIRAGMKVYCEMPDGRAIHNVTRNRRQDLDSLEHLLNAIIVEIRRDNAAAAARYMGTLAHLLEDSVSPAHAGKLPDAVAALRKRQPLPNPPPWAGRRNEHGGNLSPGNLHAAIELTIPPLSLAGRGPQKAGETVPEAAAALLDRCYAVVVQNEADLLEVVRATYADDLPTLERLRLRAARHGAELLADAFFTALSIALDTGR